MPQVYAVRSRIQEARNSNCTTTGTLDLFNAIILATIFRAQPYMGATYWIPAFWVPALLVTHYITFVFLWKYWKEQPN